MTSSEGTNESMYVRIDGPMGGGGSGRGRSFAGPGATGGNGNQPWVMDRTVQILPDLFVTPAKAREIYATLSAWMSQAVN
jgi:hypothetical protein